jgi:hypothetical protein
VGVAAGALALPALAVLYYGARLDLGLRVTDYALMLVTSATGSIATAVMGALVCGSLASSLVLILSRPSRAPETPVTVRGPVTYAGPGSLGGTESAL